MMKMEMTTMKRIGIAGVAVLALAALSGCAQGPTSQPAGYGVTVPAPQASQPTQAAETASAQPTNQASQATQATQPPPASPASPTSQAQQPGTQPADQITQQQAQEIALAHAQVAAGTTNVYCVYDREFDWPRSNSEWDCEFIVGDLEYSYEIDAVTGQIINFERESVWD